MSQKRAVSESLLRFYNFLAHKYYVTILSSSRFIENLTLRKDAFILIPMSLILFFN